MKDYKINYFLTEDKIVELTKNIKGSKLCSEITKYLNQYKSRKLPFFDIEVLYFVDETGDYYSITVGDFKEIDKNYVECTVKGLYNWVPPF